MPKTRLGDQPARQLLDERGLNITKVALEIGATFPQVQAAVTGRSRPNNIVREKLPALLDMPLERLFTSEALEPPGSGRNRRRCTCSCCCAQVGGK